MLLYSPHALLRAASALLDSGTPVGDCRSAHCLARRATEPRVVPASNCVDLLVCGQSGPFLEILEFSQDGRPLVGNDRYAGYCVDLMEKLAARVNLTSYVFKEVLDNKYGNTDANGVWNGMIGEVIRRVRALPPAFSIRSDCIISDRIGSSRSGLLGEGYVLLTQEADMAVAPLTITESRAHVVDFSTPYLDLGLSIMMYRHNNSETQYLAFMDPVRVHSRFRSLLCYAPCTTVHSCVAAPGGLALHRVLLREHQRRALPRALPAFTSNFLVDHLPVEYSMLDCLYCCARAGEPLLTRRVASDRFLQRSRVSFLQLSSFI